MKYVLGFVTALSLLAMAQTPTIIATLANKSGGKISFTSVRGNCPEGDLMAYTQSKSGKIELTGCYQLIDDEMFVKWSDGDVYTYPLDSLQISRELERQSGRRL
jgi:hypothetical protein